MSTNLSIGNGLAGPSKISLRTNPIERVAREGCPCASRSRTMRTMRRIRRPPRACPVRRRIRRVVCRLRAGRQGFSRRADRVRARRSDAARCARPEACGSRPRSVCRVLADKAQARRRDRRRDRRLPRPLAEDAARGPIARGLAEGAGKARAVGDVRHAVSAAHGRGYRARVLCDPVSAPARWQCRACGCEAAVVHGPEHARGVRAAVRRAPRDQGVVGRRPPRALPSRHRSRQRSARAIDRGRSAVRRSDHGPGIPARRR